MICVVAKHGCGIGYKYERQVVQMHFVGLFSISSDIFRCALIFFAKSSAEALPAPSEYQIIRVLTDQCKRCS